jgi:hypothetical protein
MASSAELAAGWIDAWTRMDMPWLQKHLAPDFVHVSPFGRLAGRDSYLATVEPMARKSVMELSIKGLVAEGGQAVVWFENTTPRGVIPTCDWLRVEGSVIQEIRSFYDPSPVRETLTPAEQERLDGSG